MGKGGGEAGRFRTALGAARVRGRRPHVPDPSTPDLSTPDLSTT